MARPGIQRQISKEQFKAGMQFLTYKGEIYYFEILSGHAHIKSERLLANS